mmetsp:Transcript_4675/g.8116  ORF Transcript_4675/g.8116 Transcript_4675/m.8116 type:complete len:89 (+) Transcript_4675:411-677(+)
MACDLLLGARVVILDNNDAVMTLVDGTTRVDRLRGRDGLVIVLDLDASLTVTTTKSFSSIEEGNVICKEDASCRWMYIAKQDRERYWC